MGWCRRKGKKAYRWCYRLGDRVVTRYYLDDVGWGPGSGIARHVARTLRRDKRKRRRERERIRAAEAKFFEPWDEAQALVTRWCDVIEDATAEILAAVGYWRPQRGQWRKARMQTLAPIRDPQSTAIARTPRVLSWHTEPGELVTLAVAGDEEARFFLGQQAKADPRSFNGFAMADSDGSLFGREVVDHILDRLVGDDVHGRAGVEIAMRQLRASLEGPHPTFLDRLLITRIVLSWLTLQCLERACAFLPDCTDDKRRELFERRVERAQRGYLLALRSLAQVRRLPLPQIQLNIAAAGHQQINLVGAPQVQPRAQASAAVVETSAILDPPAAAPRPSATAPTLAPESNKGIDMSKQKQKSESPKKKAAKQAAKKTAKSKFTDGWTGAKERKGIPKP